ncbi:MAG: ribosomal-protein-alanine N-acetyltransferase [Acidobacteria bacterium]|nr:MAG: ribosomal-protein-alanine N-acetyltransferase [Acidobacteriota bacterium]
MAAINNNWARLNLNVRIERMSEHDLLDVVEIEKISGLSPWGWDAYYKELQSTDSIMLVARDSVSPNNAEDSGRIIGFIVARLLASELHINNVAVRPEHRRFGAGASLVDAALNWARNKRSDRAVLEVRAGNRAAQALYRRCGFVVEGRRRRYYASPVEDALLMSVSLGSEA